MFIAASFIAGKTWKEIDVYQQKQRYISWVYPHSCLTNNMEKKKTNVLIQATTYISASDLTLNEKRQVPVQMLFKCMHVQLWSRPAN